jgi:hypothetical protein
MFNILMRTKTDLSFWCATNRPTEVPVHRQKNAICACIRDDRSQLVGNSLRFVHGAYLLSRRPLLEKFYIANSDSSLI